MKLAYWPGCVSRGFTPELHGSTALVAPKLDLELVELDRANCCGAGVIAEHNQELADTLNARTFAMAQAVDGAAGMMNIRSEEHTSELQSPMYLVCRLLLEKKNVTRLRHHHTQ